MAMQAQIGLTRHETIDYAASLIDVIVQLKRHEGQRTIAEIAVARELVG